MVENTSGMRPERHDHRDYRSSSDVLTRRGGVFWGLVLIIVGTIWTLGVLGYIEVKLDIMLPLLVVILGIWLLVTRIAR